MQAGKDIDLGRCQISLGNPAFGGRCRLGRGLLLVAAAKEKEGRFRLCFWFWSGHSFWFFSTAAAAAAVGGQSHSAPQTLAGRRSIIIHGSMDYRRIIVQCITSPASGIFPQRTLLDGMVRVVGKADGSAEASSRRGAAGVFGAAGTGKSARRNTDSVEVGAVGRRHHLCLCTVWR